MRSFGAPWPARFFSRNADFAIDYILQGILKSEVRDNADVLPIMNRRYGGMQLCGTTLHAPQIQ
jgi:hypothetical protein